MAVDSRLMQADKTASVGKGNNVELTALFKVG